MIEALNRFIERRSRPLTLLATTIGGGYLLVSYIKSKLNEIQEELTRNRLTTDNLRRRFHQNQDDCLFTITALVPTIGNQILESMNVERLADLLNQTKKPRQSDQSEPITPNSNQQVTCDVTAESENRSEKHKDPVPLPNIEVIPEEDTSLPQPDLPSAINGSSSMTGESERSALSSNRMNGLPPSMIRKPESEAVIDVLLRPDGTALRKRSEIWKEVMVLSFTRLFTCLYGIALLTLQTHIQLGLLGRDAYLSSVISADDPDAHAHGPDEHDRLYVIRKHDLMDASTERRYLTFSWWYLHHGWRLLSNRIRVAVEDVLSRKSLKDDISLADLSQIFRDIRSKVEEKEDGEPFSFSPVLLPSTTLDELETLRSGGMSPIDCVVNARLRELLNETQDFIDCDDFQLVLVSLMDRVTRRCLQNVAQKSNVEFVHPRFVELNNDDLSETQKKFKTSRFVTLLPIITRESHHILNMLPNEYTELLSNTDELKEFSSVIYTSFDSYS